jgi:LysM repeat protein
MTTTIHPVAPGDTLTSIARQYDVKIRHLKALNGLQSSQLFLGQSLLIRVEEEDDSPVIAKSRSLVDTSSSQHVVKAGETLYRIAINYKVTVDQIKKDNNLKSDTLSVGTVLRIGSNQPITTPVSPQNFKNYTVVKGDTLSKIARESNTTIVALRSLNNLKSDALSIGQVLKVSVSVGGNTFPPIPPLPPTPPPVVVKPPVVNPLVPTPPLAPTPNPNPPVNPSSNSALLSRREDTAYNLYLDIRLLNNEVRSFKLIRKLNGYSLSGQARAVPTHAAIAAAGLTPQIFNALQFCKKVEGHYDAINTYDVGIFSYGFIQFAAKFSLNQLLQSMKTYAPLQFQQTFERAGITVRNGQVSVASAPSIVNQVQLWEYIKSQSDLFVPFIQAGFVQELVVEQYRVANALYAVPSLTAMLNLNLANGARIQTPVSTVLRDLETQALAIAMGVNLGPNYMAMVLSEALSDLAQNRSITDANFLASTSWRDICSHLIAFETVPRPDQSRRKSALTIERARKILEVGVPVVLV